MQDSSSSSKDMTGEAPPRAPAVYHPCFLLDTLRALFLKCLGIEIISHQSCPSAPQAEAASSSSTGDQNVDQPSTSTTANPDPPTTTLDPQADPPTGVNSTVVELAAPSRPGVQTGSGPQTN